MRTSIRLSAACLSLAFGCSLASSQVWFGGDPDGSGAWISMQHGSGGFNDARVYDDFQWNSADDLSSAFGYFTSNFVPTTAYIEIRQGVSDGNAGTLIYGGDYALSVDDLGITTDPYAPLERYRVSANLGSLAMTNGGTYFLTISLDGDANGFALAEMTGGANSIGSPIGNGNSFLDEPGGFNYAGLGVDFAYGVSGSHRVLTPEPVTMSLGLAGLGLFLRRRRSKAS